MVRETVGACALQQIRPAGRLADESGTIPSELLAKAWELGLVRGCLPENVGGYGDSRSAVTGAIVWENTNEADADASFAPTSAIPGVVFTGKDVGGELRAYDADRGTRLASFSVGVTLAAAPAMLHGIVIVGSGTGERGADPTDPAAVEAMLPVDITAFCVAGTRGCASPRPPSSVPHSGAASIAIPAGGLPTCLCRCPSRAHRATASAT